MKNSLNFIAEGSGAFIFSVVVTIVTVIAFSTTLLLLWWVDKKKRPIKDLFINIKNGVVSVFEKVYDFFNYNSEVKTVYSDKSMNYSGTEFLPIPTKAPTNQYTYEFIGWDKNGVDEKGNIVVKAIYLQKVKECYINVFDDDKITLLHSAVVEYGAGVNLSDIKPTKPETREFSYEFVGWDKDTTAFYKNENVYAVYNAIPKKYTYTFFAEDGETVVSQGTAIYGTPIIAPKPPKKDSTTDVVYEFVGWKNYTDGMLLTKNLKFVCEYEKKVVGGIGTSSIVKTEGEGYKVVVEDTLSDQEDMSQEQIRTRKLANAMRFDIGSKNDENIEELKFGGITIRRNIVKNKNNDKTETFKKLNSANVQTNDDINQKIHLVSIKRTTDSSQSNSNVIKIKPKNENVPDEDNILKNLQINKIKINKNDDK